MADLYLKSCGCWVKKSAHHILSHFPHPQLPHLHQQFPHLHPQLPHLRPQTNFYSWIIYYLISVKVTGIVNWAVYYSSPQSFKIIRWLNIFGTFIEFWFIKLRDQTFQPLFLIYRRGNFVFHNWGCTSMYWPMSYLFRSLACIRGIEQWK